MATTQIPKPLSAEYIKNMIRRMLLDEGWALAEPRIVTIGPDCEPVVLGEGE